MDVLCLTSGPPRNIRWPSFCSKCSRRISLIFRLDFRFRGNFHPPSWSSLPDGLVQRRGSPDLSVLLLIPITVLPLISMTFLAWGEK